MQPISRRLFLAGSAAALTTAAAAIAACSDGESVPDEAGPTTDGSSTGAPLASASTVDTVPLPSAPASSDLTTPDTIAIDLGGDPFTLGVASGDPGVGGVVLWTRLAPDPLNGGGMPSEDVDVLWEVSADEAFTTVAANGTAIATPDHGHSVHVLAAIDPGWWYYRFRVGGYTSPVGRTQPAPTETSQLVRFASASCQNYQDGFYTAHRDIADQQLDFVVFLGDYIYEGGAATIGENFVVRTHGTPEADTLEAYRNRYALYKSDADLQAAHAACPWFVTWDDHEVENNYAGLVPQNAAEAASFSDRRRAAYQAWWEHQPVNMPAPDASSDDFTIYRSAQWGDLVHLAILDGRQYRSDQACGDPGLSLDPPCAETFDEARSLLGDEQEQWLLESLESATAAWRVIGQQTIFGDVTLGGAVLNYDQWDGYPVQRNRIVSSLDPTKNTIVLTGDIHFAGAGIIRQGGRGVGPAVGVELVATSIASGGRIDPAVNEVVKAIPDIVDVELEHRGYILHSVTPDQWSAEYRMVETVKEPGAPMFVHTTVIVAAGSNDARVS